MAHNIWGSRFYGHREPAWHKLGTVNDTDQTAQETYRQIGAYDVELVPLEFSVNKVTVKSDYSHVVRMPTADDPATRVFGSPVRDYELITPAQSAKMWDTQIGAPVETFAVLGKGEKLFMTAVLPSFTVAGFDEVRNYLLFFSPVHPGLKAGAYVTSIRTVCENTLRAGIAAASQGFAIPHTSGAADRLSCWMKGRYEQAVMTVDVLRESYELLAKTQVAVPQVKWIAETVYPLPKRPLQDSPRKTAWEVVLAEYEYNLENAVTRRSTVVELFEGAGTGLDDSRLRGSAWSAYNAVAEVETFRKGPNASIAVSLIDGERANRIMKSHDMLVEIARS